jgi:hypothetical protein
MASSAQFCLSNEGHSIRLSSLQAHKGEFTKVVVRQSTFTGQLSKKKLNSIPYLTRIKEMDRVGVEPTTAAHKLLDCAYLSKLWQMWNELF